jgi:hypothetical protein
MDAPCARLSPSAQQLRAEAIRLNHPTFPCGLPSDTDLDQELASADPSGQLARRAAAPLCTHWDKRCLIMIGILMIQYCDVLKLLVCMGACEGGSMLGLWTEVSCIRLETALVVAAIVAQRIGLFNVHVVRPVHPSRFEQVCIAPGFILIVKLQILVVRISMAHTTTPLLAVLQVCLLWIWIGQAYLRVLNDIEPVTCHAPKPATRSSYIEQVTYGWSALLVVSQFLPAGALFAVSAAGIMLGIAPEQQPAKRTWRHQVTSMACSVLFGCAVFISSWTVFYRGLEGWNHSVERVVSTTLCIIMTTAAMCNRDPAEWRSLRNSTFAAMVVVLCAACCAQSFFVHTLLRMLVVAICARPLHKMIFECELPAHSARCYVHRSRFT